VLSLVFILKCWFLLIIADLSELDLSPENCFMVDMKNITLKYEGYVFDMIQTG